MGELAFGAISTHSGFHEGSTELSFIQVLAVDFFFDIQGRTLGAFACRRRGLAVIVAVVVAAGGSFLPRHIRGGAGYSHGVAGAIIFFVVGVVGLAQVGPVVVSAEHVDAIIAFVGAHGNILVSKRLRIGRWGKCGRGINERRRI